jgi:hypothetical protein
MRSTAECASGAQTRLAFAGALAVPAGEQQPGVAEGLHYGVRGSGGGEGGEQVRHGLLDGGVGVGAGVACGVVGQADGQRGDQLAAAGLRQDPAAHAGAQEMQFSLAELAFHAEQHPVAVVAGVIEAVFVADQRAAEGADLRQPVPVGVVPGQPGAFQAQHDPGLAHAHVGGQPLESFPVGSRGAGLALVDVDDDDLLAAPAERDRAPAQVVLPQCRAA